MCSNRWSIDFATDVHIVANPAIGWLSSSHCYSLSSVPCYRCEFTIHNDPNFFSLKQDFVWIKLELGSEDLL